MPPTDPLRPSANVERALIRHLLRRDVPQPRYLTSVADGWARRAWALLRAVQSGASRLLLATVAEQQVELHRMAEGRDAARAAEAAALRRLERDIHDGPQQRLVRITMDLGRAQPVVAPGRPHRARRGDPMRVVIADDSLLLREGLQLLLADGGHDVVAAVGDGPGFVRATLEHRPDVAIVDVRMPPSHTDEGLRVAVEVRSEWPAARILVLSQYVEVSYAEDLFATGDGGVGYLLKDRVGDIDEFLGALDRVAAGCECGGAPCGPGGRRGRRRPGRAASPPGCVNVDVSPGFVAPPGFD